MHRKLNPLDLCDNTVAELMLECGHRLHINFSKYTRIYKCPECKTYISEFSMYRDILYEAGMKEPENYYLKISGTTAMNGLAKILIETEGSPLEKVLERANSMYNSIYTIFPKKDREIFNYALITGNRRVVKFLKLQEKSYDVKLSDELFERAWENNWLELISDLYDMNVYPVNYRVERNPIMLAAKYGDYALMSRLISSGANLNKKHKGLSPLTLVCQSENFKDSDEIIKFINHFWQDLLGENSFEFDQTDSPLISALLKGNSKLFEVLLKKGVKTSITLINLAIDVGSLEWVKILHNN